MSYANITDLTVKIKTDHLAIAEIKGLEGDVIFHAVCRAALAKLGKDTWGLDCKIAKLIEDMHFKTRQLTGKKTVFVEKNNLKNQS